MNQLLMARLEKKKKHDQGAAEELGLRKLQHTPFFFLLFCVSAFDLKMGCSSSRGRHFCPTSDVSLHQLIRLSARLLGRKRGKFVANSRLHRCNKVPLLDAG